MSERQLRWLADEALWSGNDTPASFTPREFDTLHPAWHRDQLFLPPKHLPGQ